MAATLAQTPLAAQAPASVATAAQGPAVVRFDIPAGPLDEALRAFERTTGVTADTKVPADTLRLIYSPGVAGLYSLPAALASLLDGTSLAATRTAAGFTIDVAGVRESLEVTGRLPRVESPRYATTLSNTPQTIQVIPQGVMAEQGSFTLSDAMRNVPGITLQAGEGGGASSTGRGHVQHARLQCRQQPVRRQRA